MPEFVLESFGVVGRGKARKEFRDLSPFCQGYVEALFFTEAEIGTTRDERTDSRGRVRATWQKRVDAGQISDMPGDYGFADLAADALDSIVADCAAFEAKAADLLTLAYERDYDETQAGRDFWFTRNRHGVGFWDREELDAESVGADLSNIAEAAGESFPYVGDDRRVYLA